jgi:hypothetical protein
MNRNSHRLWYFEAHLPDGSRCQVGRDGETLARGAALAQAYAGTEAQAHLEADRRCAAYERRHPVEPRAISFSPAATLALPDSN